MSDPIFIDTYQDDGNHDWKQLPNDVDGAVLKTTQGLRYSAEAWLGRALAGARAVRALRALAARTFVIGMFHYLDLTADGAAQADFFMKMALPLLAFAHPDDLLPVVDVEGDANSANSRVHPLMMQTCVSAFAKTIKQYLGRGPILYSYASFLRERGVIDHMNCEFLWIADYNEELPASAYEEVGWTRPWAWQYAGDNVGKWKGRSASAGSFGKCDMSVGIAPDGGPCTMEHVLRATVGAPR